MQWNQELEEEGELWKGSSGVATRVANPRFFFFHDSLQTFY